MAARVFLVDDEGELRALWREMLEGDGHTVIEAGSIAEVRRRLSEGLEADIAIVDWTLPDGKGLAVRDALVAAGMALPLIYATGLGVQNLPASHGARRVLAKPFRMRTLLDAVRELTGDEG